MKTFNTYTMQNTTDIDDDENQLINEDYDPEELAGDVDSGPDGLGVPSGSPSMEPDDSDWGNGDTLGNNDGTEPDPTMTDEVD